MLYLGINLHSFEILLSTFNRVWTRKRTRIFSTQDLLGLSLVWMNRLPEKSIFALCLLWHKAVCHTLLTWVWLACIDVFANFPGPVRKRLPPLRPARSYLGRLTYVLPPVTFLIWNVSEAEFQLRTLSRNLERGMEVLYRFLR
jgi:hypothetical protein